MDTLMIGEQYKCHEGSSSIAIVYLTLSVHKHLGLRIHLMTFGTQVMFASLEVKGEATLASVSEREIPAWAAFSAWRGNEEMTTIALPAS
jgi:hypothetical protein